MPYARFPPIQAALQFPAHLLDLDRFALVGEGGIAVDYKQPRQFRQVRDELIRDTIAEIFLGGIAADVRKGQHRDGGLIGQGKRRALGRAESRRKCAAA
jgi:hypothetical protein